MSPVDGAELGEEFSVSDEFSTDDEDPGQKAARKIDWELFMASLTNREKSVVEGLLTGLNGSEIWRALGIDPSTIRYFKQRLAVKILDYMGPDILAEIRRMVGDTQSVFPSNFSAISQFERGVAPVGFEIKSVMIILWL